MIRIAHILTSVALVATLSACSATPVAAPAAPSITSSEFRTSTSRLGIPSVGSARAAYEARAVELKAPAAEPGRDS